MGLLLFYLIAITWAIFSYSNVFFMFAPYLGLLGIPSEQMGVLVGSFYAAATLGRPLGGWVVERAGMQRTLVVSALLCFLTALFKFFTVSFWPLLAVRLAMGCAFGVFVVGLSTYQSLIIPEEERGASFALITLGALACLFTVIPLADWLLSRNFQRLFLTVPLCMSALCVALSLRLPPLPDNVKTFGAGEWGTWGELYRETPFWRTVTSCLLFNLCDASIIYLPVLVLAMGLVPSAFIIANGLGALVMRVWGRRFFNRFPRYVFAGPSLFVMAVFLFLTTQAQNNTALFLCGFLYGMGMGYGYPAHLALIGDVAPMRLRAKSSSLVHFCTDVSWFALPVYVGFATPHIGGPGAFRSLAILCVLSGIGVTAMWFGYGRKKT